MLDNIAPGDPKPKDDLRCEVPENAPRAYISRDAMVSHMEDFCKELTGDGSAESPEYDRQYDTETYEG
jgi:hypothetical protein